MPLIADCSNAKRESRRSGWDGSITGCTSSKINTTCCDSIYTVSESPPAIWLGWLGRRTLSCRDFSVDSAAMICWEVEPSDPARFCLVGPGSPSSRRLQSCKAVLCLCIRNLLPYMLRPYDCWISGKLTSISPSIAYMAKIASCH